MSLHFLMLADAVSSPPDGKFYVHGGGFTRLTVPQLPFVVPQIGVLARLLIDDGEVGEVRNFSFEMRDQAEIVVGQMLPFQAVLPPELVDLVEGEPRFVNVAVNLGPTMVVREGAYSLRFLVDGEEFGSAAFWIVVAPPAPVEP